MTPAWVCAATFSTLADARAAFAAIEDQMAPGSRYELACVTLQWQDRFAAAAYSVLEAPPEDVQNTVAAILNRFGGERVAVPEDVQHALAMRHLRRIAANLGELRPDGMVFAKTTHASKGGQYIDQHGSNTEPPERQSMSWEAAGMTGVDAGIIMITDPCYVVRDPGEPEYAPFRSYREHFLPELERQDRAAGRRPLEGEIYQITNEHGALSGVVVGGFGGDGVFPVYVERDQDGRVIAAMIRFDDEPPVDGQRPR